MVKQKSDKQFKMKGRFWIEGPQGTFLGHGRIRLLERIKEHGSISAAARAMNMSYRRAWNLVDAINQQSTKPIVVKKTGGRGGGGAELTDTGKRVIDVFWTAHRDFESYIQQRNKTLSL